MPLCESWMFWTPRRRKWRTTGKKSGYRWKDTGDKPVYEVSVARISHTILGQNHKRAHLGIQVMVDHFSDLTYVHLMGNIIQEEKL